MWYLANMVEIDYVHSFFLQITNQREIYGKDEKFFVNQMADGCIRQSEPRKSICFSKYFGYF